MHGTTVSFVNFCLHCHADLLYAVAVAHNQGFEDQKTYNKVIKALPKKHRPSKKERRTAILVPYIKTTTPLAKVHCALTRQHQRTWGCTLGIKLAQPYVLTPRPRSLTYPEPLSGKKNKTKKQIGRFCRQLWIGCLMDECWHLPTICWQHADTRDLPFIYYMSEGLNSAWRIKGASATTSLTYVRDGSTGFYCCYCHYLTMPPLLSVEGGWYAWVATWPADRWALYSIHFAG